MQAAVNAFDQTAQDLMTALQHMKQFLDQDASSGVYKGNQADAFNVVREQVEADLQKAGNNLTSMSTTMKNVLAKYQTQDAEIKQQQLNVLGGIQSSAGNLNPSVSGLLPTPAGAPVPSAPSAATVRLNGGLGG
jgi:uncharacterized protein YukE